MTPIIQITTDYDKFRFMPDHSNRNPNKVKFIKQSITDIDLSSYVPIIVSSDFYIIDGQNRFLACKELDLPIYYVVLPSVVDNHQALAHLNIQYKWRPEEWLNFWKATKGGCYDDFNKFIETYKIGMETAKILYPNRSINSATIRNGVPFEKWEFADDCASYLLSGDFPKLKFSQYKEFTAAIRIVFTRYNAKQLNKLRSKALSIPRMATREQYLTTFDNIVNYTYSHERTI